MLSILLVLVNRINYRIIDLGTRIKHRSTTDTTVCTVCAVTLRRIWTGGLEQSVKYSIPTEVGGPTVWCRTYCRSRVQIPVAAKKSKRV